MMAKQLMKKGKLEVAAYIKAECNKPPGHAQLITLLDYLLDPNKPLDDTDRLDWCRSLIAGGTSFEEYAKIVSSYNNSTICGLVWTADYVAYRCRTCGFSPCMSLCSDCFQAADHTGHDFNMFRSQAGGACDCGDENVLNPKGFCSRHGKDKSRPLPSVPKELVMVAEIMMPRLIFRLLQHFRHNFSIHHEPFTISIPDIKAYLNFLQQLTDMGAIMFNIITNVVTNTFVYNTFTKDLKSNTLMAESQKKYLEAMEHIRPLQVPEEFKDVAGLDTPLTHTTLLDELFYWMMNYEFPQQIVTILLSMLPNEVYKVEFTKIFVRHYSYIVDILTRTNQKSRMSNCLVHISVQLLSPPNLATQMVTQHHLLHIMLISLHKMINSILTLSDVGTHQVVDCMHSIMKDHFYWPVVSDVINVFSHKPVAFFFMSNRVLVSYWAKVISCFQGMNLNVRELNMHVEYEPDCYYAAFSVELELCASPLWSLLTHIEDQETKEYTKTVVEIFVQSLQDWFNISETRPFQPLNPLNLSFHYPLHRYLSIFINNAVVNQGLTIDELLPSQEFLHLLSTHPLQLLVGFHEIFCGLWVRNGQQIRGQAMTYLQCHFCNSTVDADYHLLQVIASKVDPDYFVKNVLDRFHVSDMLTFIMGPNLQKSFLTRDHEVAMLESALYFLCTLLSVRTFSGGTRYQDIVQQELITLLCMSDRTHSQLSDAMPDRCGHLVDHSAEFEEILSRFSEYKAPMFEVGGALQQGKYIPKGTTWVEQFNPLHILLRSLHRRDFQSSIDRFTEYVKQQGLYKGTSNPWPPLRIPSPVHPAYTGLMKLLHCRTMHALLFTILYKAVNQKNMTDTVLFLAVHLLELAVTIPNPDAHKKEILISEQLQDKQFSRWYKSDNIFTNVSVKLPEITTRYYHLKESEMVVDLHSDSLTDDIDDQISHLTVESDPSYMALVMASGNSVFYPQAVMPSRGTSPYKPECQSLGVTADFSQEWVEEQVPVNESILTLLLKLHDKLSKKTDSYLPESARGTASNETMDSRIGSGEFFVGKVLDKICRHSAKSANIIQKICLHKTSPPSTSEAGRDGHDERRRKAKQRQERLMREFASKQKQFMEQVIGSDMDNEMDSESSQTSEVEVKQTMYDCCICGQTTETSHENPIGLVTYLTPTSVLGHRRHAEEPVALPLSDFALSRMLDYATCAQEFNSRWDQLRKEFDESCLSAVNVGLQKGIHVQTCSHYMHLNCHRSYLDSLRSHNHLAAQTLQVDKGEYWCPMCRQLSNAILPMSPDIFPTPARQPTPECDLIRTISTVLLENHNSAQPVSALSSAMTSLLQNIKRAADFPVYDTSAANILFVCSLLRTNLELELVAHSGSPCLQPKYSFVQRKSCLIPLYHTIAIHMKQISLKPHVELWSHVIGVALEQHSTSLSVFCKEVPLLLKDVSAVFIQLVLAMPTTMTKSMFQCIVRALYNVQLVQAIAIISCKFLPEEHEAWRSRGQISGCNSLQGIMSHVIDNLGKCGFYDEETLDRQIPAICQSIWSPMSVENVVIDHVLTFIRLAALMQQRLFNDDAPQISQWDRHQEFVILSKFLRIEKPGNSTNQLESVDCLNWLCDDPALLVRAWCQHLVQVAQKNNGSTARVLLCTNPVWQLPQLLMLPKEFDLLFQFYRKKTCQKCQNKPRHPMLCLVCGQLICYNEQCCTVAGKTEAMSHSIECGSGTSVLLGVDTSVIIVFSGPREYTWGSVYLDKHGEEDRELKRGKPLLLNEERYRLLNQMWVTHSFDHMCKHWRFHHHPNNAL